MPKIFASKSSEIQPREVEHENIARALASECIVLLENDGVLPIRGTEKIALYGNGARATIKGGTGSGDVYVRNSTNIEKGFQKAGFFITTVFWLDRQEKRMEDSWKEYLEWTKKEAKEKGRPEFAVQMDYPYKGAPPEFITQEDVLASDTDTAVYVIARNSGEGADRFYEKGDYLLFEEEKQNLEFLASHYSKTIVILNIGGVMDLSELTSIPGINAIVLMGQLGNPGGDALLDVLIGKVNPSGKTVDTWAKNYMDYPSSKDFSHNGSIHDEYYTDGIYVGYRYFDSFGVEPIYCFGFGRSYTDFSIRTDRVEILDGRVQVTVTVKNEGMQYAGRETVQVYYTAPERMLDKPYQELAAYQKTSLLAPGESETRTLCFAVRDMASYSPEAAAWVLEKGEYVIRVGNSAKDTAAVVVLHLERDIKTQMGKNLFPLDCEMEEICPRKAEDCEMEEIHPKKAEDSCESGKEFDFPKRMDKVTKETPRMEISADMVKTEQMQYSKEREAYVTDKAEKLTMQDVREGRCSVQELVAQLSVEEMAELCVGTARRDGGSVIGNASCFVPGAAGDTSSVIEKDRGVQKMIFADGPAGLRLQPHFRATKDGTLLPEQRQEEPEENKELEKNKESKENEESEKDKKSKQEAIDYYQYCTAIPIGWSLAQSWSTDAAEKAGDVIGSEMEQFHVDLWLAPALNIHRNPLCGRNFEYYSEDPLVAGKVAAAITNGVQKHPGKGTTIKHFAVNNQEDNRYFVNAHVSERALREIYLKGFEIAVKESQPFSIMTSYNLLNGAHTANHYGLIQGMARDEWGFEGVIMTDWETSQPMPWAVEKFHPRYPIASSVGCIAVGNDLQMPGCKKNVDDIIEAVKTGKEIDGFRITLADLQHAAENIIRIADKTTEGYADYRLEVTKEKGVDINPRMYGLFFEDINYSADGGLYAELLENRSFEFLKALGDKNAYYQEQAYDYHWSMYPEDAAYNGIKIKGTQVEYTGAVKKPADDQWDGTGLNENNPHYMEFTATDGARGFKNAAYHGLALKKDQKYLLSFYAKSNGYQGEIKAYVRQRANGDKTANGEKIANGKAAVNEGVIAQSIIKENISTDWKQYQTVLTAVSDCTGADFVMELTQNGIVDFDMISLMPEDAVLGVFRKDMFDMLKEMKPGFLRFPGGCIVEGNTLENRYRWKESLGDVAERKNNWSRWAVHQEKGKYDSYYNQSLGIGYYEYFLLSELLGAEPMPIVNVGLACEYQSDEKVAVGSKEFEEYIQDALDLIEFANGDASTKWGAKRAALGHPEPFGLKFLGVGNEQWEGATWTEQGTKVDYFARYEAFEKAIHKKHPKIQLIGCAGETNSGEHYESAWSYFGEKKNGFVSAVDEHYYTTDEWLLENSGFYDNYSRKREAKVFVGEYAGTGNTWNSALAEAAYMTGMERNADVVDMASYAPLFAREGYTQWTRADLIYFNETVVYGTPNYYVQKLYSTNLGNYTLQSKASSECGGKLYQSVSYDKSASEIIIKLVNHGIQERSIKVILPEMPLEEMKILWMAGNGLAKNSFAEPEKIAPAEGKRPAEKEFVHIVPPMSFTIIRAKMEESHG